MAKAKNMVYEYISFPLTFAKVFGLWISYESSAFYLFYFLFIMATQYFFALFQAVYAYTVLTDIPKFAEASYLLLTQATLCYKIYIFLADLKSVRSLMDTMLTESKFEADEPEYIKLMEKRSTRCKRLFLLFANMATTTIFFWAIFPVLDKKSAGKKVLPFKAWYPMTKDRTPYYEILYVYQIVGILISAYVNSAIDFIAISMMTFGQTQMEIVNSEFRKIVITSDDLENDFDLDKNDKPAISTEIGLRDFNEKIYDRILLCVRRHQCAIKFLRKVEKTFHKIAVSQMIASVLIICITGLQLVIMKPASLEFVSMVLYFMAMLTQIFVYCWQGNEITVTSLELVDAAYTSTWYILNRKNNMTLFTFFERLRKPVIIRAGNFFPLSLQTFVSLLRSSYSYFALLQQLNSEQ